MLNTFLAGRRLFRIAVCGLVIMFSFTSCSGLYGNVTLIKKEQHPAEDEQVSEIEGGETYSWGKICFTLDWPEDSSPEGSLDYLLAHRVLRPLLERESAGIAAWRFHRRAVRDKSGHQLSFLFYATQQSAANIVAGARTDRTVRELQQEGYIEKTHFLETIGNNATDIASTSDNSWPIELQSEWPYFIMGVSSTWLGLISSYGEMCSRYGDSLEKLLRCYRLVEQKTERLWTEEGQHAFLHHLSGIFGYTPLKIQTRIEF